MLTISHSTLSLRRTFRWLNLARFRVSTGNGLKPLSEAHFILCRANLAGRFDEALALSRRLLLRCFHHVSTTKGSTVHSIH